MDDGLDSLDATKAFQDLAERYVRSNDDIESKVPEKLKRCDCQMRFRLQGTQTKVKSPTC